MVGMILAAFVLGVVVAMPPGPVLISGSQRAIASGFWRACRFYAGVTLSDTFYVLLVYFGLSALVAENQMFRLALWILGGAWLCKMGLDAIRTPINLGEMDAAVGTRAHWQDFRSGVLITLFNPLTIVGWIGIAGTFFAQWSADWPPRESVGFVAIVAILSGVVAWALGLALLLSVTRRMFSPLLLHRISMLSGLLLLIYGLSAWWSALDLLI